MTTRCAYREGYGLDPDGAGWAPGDPEIAALRARAEAAPGFSGAWWAVGAYLEGVFPPYAAAPPALVARRWRRFAARRQDWLPRRPPDPALFFGGLFLSEQGDRLPGADLRIVRETLRDLHAEAYDWHREQLVERSVPGPPPPAAPTSGGNGSGSVQQAGTQPGGQELGTSGSRMRTI